jgi:hypothetical protein
MGFVSFCLSFFFLFFFFFFFLDQNEWLWWWNSRSLFFPIHSLSHCGPSCCLHTASVVVREMWSRKYSNLLFSPFSFFPFFSFLFFSFFHFTFLPFLPLFFQKKIYQFHSLSLRSSPPSLLRSCLPLCFLPTWLSFSPFLSLQSPIFPTLVSPSPHNTLLKIIIKYTSF